MSASTIKTPPVATKLQCVKFHKLCSEGDKRRTVCALRCTQRCKALEVFITILERVVDGHRAFGAAKSLLQCESDGETTVLVSVGPAAAAILQRRLPWLA